MNIQQLRVFVSISSGCTLLEAANKLGLKQPTVSFHLRKLEEELGVELWYKHGRGYRPNETALTLLPYARKIVALMNEAELQMNNIRLNAVGKIKIGASHTPATYVLPSYLAQYRTIHPEHQIILTVKKASSVLDMLKQHEVDAAIVSLPKNTKVDGLMLYPLMEDELKLFISPNHPLTASETITIEQLQNETFLLHEKGTTSRQLTDEWGKKVGLTFKHSMEMGAIETIKAGLKCNMGVGVLPWRSTVSDTEIGLLVEKPLPHYTNNRYICLVLRDDELITFELSSFIRFVRDHLSVISEHKE